MRFYKAAYSILKGMFTGKKNKRADKRGRFRGSRGQVPFSKRIWQALW
jgi:hypothetical protein